MNGFQVSQKPDFLLCKRASSWTYIEIDVNGRYTVVFTVEFSHFGNEGKVTMNLSITRSFAAAVVVGSALMISTTDGNAMTAEEHEAALEQCNEMMKGQRSFCAIEANNAYATSAAKEKKQDVTVHYNYDTTNDTPEEKTAHESYTTALDKCLDLPKGQRSFCSIEAHSEYMKGM